MNERANCTACTHRRALTSMVPGCTVCHYLLDSGKPRGCPAEECLHWQSETKTAEQWTALLRRIREGDAIE